MISTMNLIEKKVDLAILPKLDTSKTYVAISIKSDLFGISIGNEFLMQKYKEMASFRVNFNNILQFKSIEIFSTNLSIDNNIVRKYFNRNRDNPYAITHFLNSIIEQTQNNYNSVNISSITQYPPLEPFKTIKSINDDLKIVEENLKLGDLLLSSNKNSRISKHIINVTKEQWSHCGNVISNKKIFEMTVQGISNTNFNTYYDSGNNVALYRIKGNNPKTKEIEKEIEKFINKNKTQKIYYNWEGVFWKYFLIKTRLEKHFKSMPTPGSLIKGNHFDLIAYA